MFIPPTLEYMYIHTGTEDLFYNSSPVSVDIRSVRVSCKSDLIIEGVDYAFLCIYTIGNFEAKKILGRNIYPGYFYIRRTDAIMAEEAEW